MNQNHSRNLWESLLECQFFFAIADFIDSQSGFIYIWRDCMVAHCWHRAKVSDGGGYFFPAQFSYNIFSSVQIHCAFLMLVLKTCWNWKRWQICICIQLRVYILRMYLWQVGSLCALRLFVWCFFPSSGLAMFFASASFCLCAWRCFFPQVFLSPPPLCATFSVTSLNDARRFLIGRKRNVQHWIGHPNFELIDHDVTNPLHVQVCTPSPGPGPDKGPLADLSSMGSPPCWILT